MWLTHLPPASSPTGRVRGGATTHRGNRLGRPCALKTLPEVLAAPQAKSVPLLLLLALEFMISKPCSCQGPGRGGPHSDRNKVHGSTYCWPRINNAPPPGSIDFCFPPDPLLKGGSSCPERPQALTYPKGPIEKKKNGPWTGVP